MENEIIRISYLQYDIKWEDINTNLQYIEDQLKKLSDKTDLVILPEMFSTGFSMNSKELAESNNGSTMRRLSIWAKKYNIAICGSFIASDRDQFYNRGFFVTPVHTYFYDKHHLFRMGYETQSFTHGKNKLIVEHKGFNICLLICYDLRFPVWSRNVDNEYDLLIYVANWPATRLNVWNTLLPARAIENICYVCGVNRIGNDGNNLNHAGGSMIIDFKGHTINKVVFNEEVCETIELSKNKLNDFRQKFPAWKDADSFKLDLG